MPPCERMPCQNNGVCIPHEDNVHDYSCNCTKGYTGKNCETHSACESENCNGGECIAKDSNPKEFICLCPLGRVGVQCETGTCRLSLLINQLPRLSGRWVPGIPRGFHCGQPAPR